MVETGGYLNSSCLHQIISFSGVYQYFLLSLIIFDQDAILLFFKIHKQAWASDSTLQEILVHIYLNNLLTFYFSQANLLSVFSKYADSLFSSTLNASVYDSNIKEQNQFLTSETACSPKASIANHPLINCSLGLPLSSILNSSFS